MCLIGAEIKSANTNKLWAVAKRGEWEGKREWAAFNNGVDSRGDDAGICQTCHTQNSLTVIKTTSSNREKIVGGKMGKASGWAVKRFITILATTTTMTIAIGAHMANVRQRLCLKSADSY